MFRSDPRASLLRDLNRANAPAQFVSGFYSESLTKAGLVQQLGMQPAKYVDVDVDLYSSTVEVLDFLFVHGLIAPGTVIGFDDFWSIACLPNSDENSSPLAEGEALALVEAARRYNATFLCLAGGCRRSRQDERETEGKEARARHLEPSFWSRASSMRVGAIRLRDSSCLKWRSSTSRGTTLFAG